MSESIRWSGRLLGISLLALAFVEPVAAEPRRAVPHGGGGSPRASAPAPRPANPSGAPARGHVPAHGTAHGTAHYGYGYGYGGSYWGSPYWGGWYPYWSVGWYGAWGWPYYGWYPYGGWYGPYPGTYVVEGPELDPRTPAIALTRVTPSKAEVLVDGQAVGYAKDYSGRWDELSLAPGHHEVAFRAPGYTTLVIALDVQPGARYVFDRSLQQGEGEDRVTWAPPASASAEAAPAEAEAPAATSPVARGRMKVSVEPADAAVYLDGEYLGLGGELARLHGSIPVATGSHRVEVVRPGFTTDARTIEVTGEGTANVDLKLERREGP